MDRGERRIAIACGDPSGLGPELIERCLAERAYPGARFAVFGAEAWVERLAALGANRVEPVVLSRERFEPGRPVASGARLAIAALEEVAAACRAGAADAVVTGPISKARCAAEGFAFPGQTEFFAARWGGEPTMGFVGERLRAVLATWHIPLAAVPEALTESVFKRAVLRGFELARRLGIAEPRVAVCGLNPHAGEEGLLGLEERDRFDPWLAEMGGGLRCVPGDTAFMRAMRGEVDIVVALYHDQGLAPFKAVDFDSGVNVTLGLPHLRVSPDHGTGFEIAGRGLASAGSMDRAIALAATLAPCRAGEA